MGAVYLAEHPLIGKKVALKVIHRELAGNREVVQRFFQEAKAVNSIGNEHIVEIHDFGMSPDGDHFYIMEYLEGRTLASVLAKERTLGIMRALHIGAQIASALAAAHASLVIHRDLKPDNIMLMKRLGDPDFVKVLDFGLAKMFAAGAASVKTAAGVLLGTPQYMSPEACESKRDIDHRTDVYALGILLFQMLTGVLPFDGESMGEVLVKQVTALPPAPRGLNPEIPPSVEQILLRCLAKPVDARFQTMVALREALLDPEAYLRTSPPIAPARSVAPGEAAVNAKTLLAHVAAQQAGLPGLAQPTAPKNQTMQIGTPMGYSSQTPRKVWPIILVLGLLLGLGGGAFAVAWFGRTSTQGSAGDVVRQDASDAAAAAAAAAAAVDAAIAVVMPSEAAVVAIDSGPALVKLTIDSVPPGASVFGPDGALLGKTRLQLDWPISNVPIDFELRLPGYRRKPKQIVISGNTTVGVELEKLPAVPAGAPGSSRKGSGAHPGNGKGSSDTGLIRPGD